jgi:hypothetical protein
MGHLRGLNDEDSPLILWYRAWLREPPSKRRGCDPLGRALPRRLLNANRTSFTSAFLEAFAADCPDYAPAPEGRGDTKRP